MRQLSRWKGARRAMTCPTNPPPPLGYGVWRGNVPTPLVQWAIGLRDRIRNFPYGQTWALDYNGAIVLARKDHHVYSYINGQLVSGICIPGVTLYQPTTPAAAAPTSNLTATATTALAADDLTTPDPTAAVYSGE